MEREFRIAIDFNDISSRSSGFGEYACALAERIAALAPELKEKYNIRFYFLVPDGYVGCYGDSVKYLNIDAYGRFTRLALRIFPRRFDIYHQIHQFSKTRRLMFARKDVRTLHDINFVHDRTESKYAKKFRRTQRYIDRAEILALISDFVEKDVREHFSTKNTRVIYNGVTDLSRSNFPKEIDMGVEKGGYLFHLSSLMPKKNASLLIDMMDHLPNETLVIVGNWKAFGAPLREQLKRSRYNNIITMDNVDTETKAYLMAHCKAFLFPSLCEGFGLPPLEAMHFGKPVFLSRLTSLPEVGGDFAYYWDELEPRKMAQVLTERLAENTLTPEEIKRWVNRFTWEKTVQGYIDVYKTVLGING